MNQSSTKTSKTSQTSQTKTKATLFPLFPSFLPISSLFWNEKYVPINPFRQLIFSFQRLEHISALPPPFDYRIIPNNPMDRVDSRDFKNYCAYGSSKAGGLLNLGKLVSEKSLSSAGFIINSLRAELGDYPLFAKTSTASGQFIEVYSVLNAFSSELSHPRVHVLESTVEAIVSGDSLDECINIYIRRIVEEAYRADLSPQIVSSNIQVKFSGRRSELFVVTVEDMKAKREQTTSILKSAVVDDGDLYLDLHLMVKRSLPSCNNKSDSMPSTGINDETIGFVHIIRKYNFSFVDSRTGNTRCFSSEPFRSLATGVFLNIDEMKVLRKVFFDHVARSNKRVTAGKEEQEIVQVQENGFEKYVSQTLTSIATSARDQFNDVDICSAAFHCMLLQCLLLPENARFVYVMQELIAVLLSPATRIRAIRDAIASLTSVCKGLLDGISKLTYLSDDSHSLDEVQRACVDKLVRLFSTLPQAVFEIKTLIFGLLRSPMCSEVFAQSALLKTSVIALYRGGNVSVARVAVSDKDFANEPEKFASLAPGYIEQLRAQLNKIDCILQAVESSICSSVLVSCLVSDLCCEYLSQLPFPNEVTSVPDNVEQRLQHPFTTIPRTFAELFGYINALSATPARSTWHSFNPSPPVRFFLLSQALNMTKMCQPYHAQRLEFVLSTKRAEAIAAAEKLTEPLSEEGLILDNLLNSIIGVAMGSFRRLGAVDLSAACDLEVQRSNLAKCFTTESVFCRYLDETLSLKALEEASFQVSVAPRRVSGLLLTVATLFRYASFLQLNEGIPDGDILEEIFQSVRNRMIRPIRLQSFGEGTNGVQVGLVGSVLTCQGSRGILSGLSVYGCDRIIPVLGDVSTIYRNSWMLPPILPGAQTGSTGIRVQVCSGLAFNTAASWGRRPLDEIKNMSQRVSSMNRTSDIGLNAAPSPVSIEVAVILSYEHPSLEANIALEFAKVAVASIRFMSTSQRWRVLQVTPGGSSTSAGGSDASTGAYWTGSQLSTGDSATFSQLQAAIQRSGSVTLQGGFLMTDSSSFPTAEQLVSMLESAVYRSNTAGRGKARKPQGRDGLEFTEDDEFDVNEDDPTQSDSSRVLGSSKILEKISKFLAGSSSMSEYVPCQVTITGMAMYPQTISQFGPSASKFPFHSSPSKAKSKLKMLLGKAKGNENSSILLGNPRDIARLTMNTIWLSPVSARMVWQFIGGNPTKYLKLAISRSLQDHCTSLVSCNYLDAIQNGLIYALFRDALLVLPSSYRVLSSDSLAVRVNGILKTMQLLCATLNSTDYRSSDFISIANTLTRRVCLSLRSAILSPQCVHLLSGGILLIHRSILNIENILHLGSWPLDSLLEPGRHQLPNIKFTDFALGATNYDGLPPIDPPKPGFFRRIKVTQPSVISPIPIANPEIEFKQAIGKKEVVRAVVAELNRLIGLVSALSTALERDAFENIPLLHGLRWQNKSRSKQFGDGDEAFHCAGSGCVILQGDVGYSGAANQTLLSLPRSIAMEYSCGVTEPTNLEHSDPRSWSVFAKAMDRRESNRRKQAWAAMRGVTLQDINDTVDFTDTGSDFASEIFDLSYLKDKLSQVQGRSAVPGTPSAASVASFTTIDPNPKQKDKKSGISKSKLKSMVGMVTKFSRMASGSSTDEVSTADSVGDGTFAGAAPAQPLAVIQEGDSQTLDEEDLDDLDSVGSSVSSLGVGSVFDSPIKKFAKGKWKRLAATGRFVGALSGKSKTVIDGNKENGSMHDAPTEQELEIDYRDQESTLYSGDIQETSFSARGFKLIGSTAKAAAAKGSMLAVLRAFGAMGESSDTSSALRNTSVHLSQPPTSQTSPNVFSNAFGVFQEAPSRRHLQGRIPEREPNPNIERDGMLSALRAGIMANLHND